mmetsp:Transcript_20142/g.36460  ORF Transcript_20142/g.36460 Transcript_20142/m.36460 type:complete len:220 (+) Transcript_20142:52-711(+)
MAARRAAANAAGRGIAAGRRSARAASSAAPPKEDLKSLGTFFARASVAARMLESRLALPIAYPLNSGMMYDKMNVGAADQDGWSQKEIERGLAHVLPIVKGMSKMASVLKSMQALQHYHGGHQRTVAPSAAEAAKEADIRLDFIRPERWRGANFGRNSGTQYTLTGNSNWHDAGLGRPVDSIRYRIATTPWDDSPQMHKRVGSTFVSPTKWNKRKSGSQ